MKEGKVYGIRFDLYSENKSLEAKDEKNIKPFLGIWVSYTDEYSFGRLS